MSAPLEHQNSTQEITIVEPSDNPNEELLASEKACFTKKHLYIAIGVVFVVAISLIGSLLDFSPSTEQVTEESIRQGTLQTFPEFDTNGDGFIDRSEFTMWSAKRISHTKASTTTGLYANGTTEEEVDENFSPIDLNKDGRVTRDEAIAHALRQQEGSSSKGAQVASRPVSRGIKSQSCPIPEIIGFAGRRGRSYVGACQPGFDIWCYTSPLCQDKKKCHKKIINIEWTTTDTCCGSSGAANCTDCTCGGSYSFVPEGGQARIKGHCHWLSTYWCGDVDTGVSAHPAKDK
jgi:hypothetical protein